jgi:glycosyltransferase involved in cell wall biosynthesis
MKVSVCLITYNHERYIAQAIESVLMQQVSFDYEIVIGEDCSTDSTRKIVSDYASRYPDRIRLLLHERNLGPGRNVAETLRSCQGEYVASLDGDDYWTSPHKLQKQVDFLDDHLECVLCFHNVKVVYEGDETRGSWNLYPDGRPAILTVEDVLRQSSVQTSSMLVRGPRRGDEDFYWLQGLESAERNDWSVTVFAAQHGPVGYIDEVMSVYRQHAGGAWTCLGRARQLEMVIERYDKMKAHLGSAYDQLIRDQVSLRSLEAAGDYEAGGDLQKASQHLRRCLQERSPVLEQYAPRLGLLGPKVWKVLARRLWLCEHPAVYRAVGRARPVLEGLKWRALQLWMTVRAAARLVSGRSVGYIRACPNPIPEATRPSLATTTLSWTALNTDVVEVHVGAPDGSLVSRSAAGGTAVTGEWVHDGMLFYLQDVSGGKPLTFRNTLGFVRVRVGHPRRRG